MRRPEPTASERPEPVRVKLLGGFSVSVGSLTIRQDKWRLKKAASLLKLLALAPGHRMHRERAMDLLWDDVGKQAASNNLRQVVYGARRVLDPASRSRERYVGLSEEHLVLCPEGQLWVDVDAFEEAASIARRARDPATYRGAIDLYTGDLLPEDRYEEWAEERRRQLHQLYLRLILEQAELYEGREEHVPAIEDLWRAINEEPTLEEAHVALMRLQALSGRPDRALDQYEKLSHTLATTLDKQPAETTRYLRDEIAEGRFLPTSPVESPQGEESSDHGHHNLPAVRTSFVGRGRELLEVEGLLDTTRLLTLTGVGGSGKTRLALEVARDVVQTYPGGVWLVRLAPLSDPALVVQAVVETLEIPEQPGRPLVETLAEALNARTKTLLVLDNCEHLVDAVARLMETLLDSCPNLRVLATSREALLVSGEYNVLVPPLTLPETGPGAPSMEQLHGSESAQLFLERSRHRLPAFPLASSSVHAIADICRKLDGIPLAIELAAARMGTISAEQISVRLSDSLKLLTGGDRTSLPRQRTLSGTLDWSFDLLEEPEKKLFARLSVFASGWTLEAAEAVGAGEDLEEGDILNLMSRLVDKSLITFEQTDSSETRYRMLEPIRQYANRKLEDSRIAEETRHRHAEWCLAIAEEAEPELSGSRQNIWLERLEREHGNLRAALSWSLGGGSTGLGLRLAVALYMFWYTRGYLIEGREWLERATSANRNAATHMRARALNSTGWIALFQGEHEEAMPLLEEGLALFRRLNDTAGTAAALYNLGVTLVACTEYEQAETVLVESVAVHRTLEDSAGAARSLQALSLVALPQQDYERAMTVSEEGLRLSRESDDKVGIVLQHCSLALAQLGWGKHGQAHAHCTEALENAVGLKWEHGVAMGLQVAGAVAGSREHEMRAAQIWGAAEELRAAISATLSPFEQMYYRPFIETTRRRIGEAAFAAAWAEGKAMTLEDAVEFAMSEELAPKGTTGRYARITSREREIMLLVSRGLTNHQIAEELFISKRTVDAHLRKIFKKLGLGSRAQVAAWATERQSLASDQD